MKAYIAVSFSKRKLFAKVIAAITETMNDSGIEPFVFIDHYTFLPEQEQEMMQQAMNDIDGCDLLIAETSEKAIGIGIEAGYAKGKGKPVIYLRHASAEHSTTLSGISDHQVIYKNDEDLKARLSDTLNAMGLSEKITQ